MQNRKAACTQGQLINIRNPPAARGTSLCWECSQRPCGCVQWHAGQDAAEAAPKAPRADARCAQPTLSQQSATGIKVGDVCARYCVPGIVQALQVPSRKAEPLETCRLHGTSSWPLEDGDKPVGNELKFLEGKLSFPIASPDVHHGKYVTYIKPA